MPIDYAAYPPNWESEIVPRILARAGERCERCGLANGQKHPKKGYRVVICVTHLDHDEWNWSISDERLLAVCQACHLNYDRRDNIRRHVERVHKDTPTLLFGEGS